MDIHLSVHRKGEYPFTMGMDGISVFALGAMRLTQRSSNIRISSGVKDLDDSVEEVISKIP